VRNLTYIKRDWDASSTLSSNSVLISNSEKFDLYKKGLRLTSFPMDSNIRKYKSVRNLTYIKRDWDNSVLFITLGFLVHVPVRNLTYIKRDWDYSYLMFSNFINFDFIVRNLTYIKRDWDDMYNKLSPLGLEIRRVRNLTYIKRDWDGKHLQVCNLKTFFKRWEIWPI